MNEIRMNTYKYFMSPAIASITITLNYQEFAIGKFYVILKAQGRCLR